jgi:hypothetical protein
MDQQRIASINKRMIDEAEAAIEYAAWRQQTELEIEALYGTTFDPDNPRNMPSEEELNEIEAERSLRQDEDDAWLVFLDQTGLIE